MNIPSMRFLGTLLSLASFGAPSFADGALPSRVATAISRGDAAYASSDWKSYAEIYAELTTANPGNGEYWYRLARARENLGQPDKALLGYGKALEHGYRKARTLLRLASLEAARGNAAVAVDLFEQARAHHLVNAEQELQQDPALAGLLEDPRWRARLFPALDEGADALGKWRADLAFLARRMPETHWDLFEQVAKPEWEGALARLEADLPRLEEWQRSMRLMEVVRLGRSGHTLLMPPFQGDDPFHMADIRFAFFQDGFYVVAAPEASSELVGKKVSKLGTGDPETVLKALTPVLPHESESGLRRVCASFVTFPELLAYYGFQKRRDALELTLVDAEGRQQDVVLPAEPLTMQRLQARYAPGEAPPGWVKARDRSPNPVPLWLRHCDQPFFFEKLEAEKAIYLQLNTVRDAEDETLADFAVRLQKALAAPDVEALIVDVRHNGGGDGELLEPLHHALIATPKLHQRGRLYVLISGKTFSAATLFIADLERNLDPIFVGEPSGSGPTHIGEDNMILLPNTGQIVFAASRIFVRSFSDDERSAIEPHIAAAPTFADYRDNRDPGLEAITQDRRQAAAGNR